ncbi:MAG TPA: hypothetical protein VH951_09095, partial [Dehalococcoidia bacterium]
EHRRAVRLTASDRMLQMLAGRRFFPVYFFAWAALATVAVAACGGGSKSPASISIDGDSKVYAGTVSGGNLYIGMVILSTGESLTYVCDGDQTGQWFRGNANGETLHVETADGLLQANLTDKSVAGSVRLGNGQTYTFTAPRATGIAGLYRSVKAQGDVSYVGGWIVLADSSQRGLVSATKAAPPVTGATATPILPLTSTSSGQSVRRDLAQTTNIKASVKTADLTEAERKIAKEKAAAETQFSTSIAVAAATVAGSAGAGSATGAAGAGSAATSGSTSVVPTAVAGDVVRLDVVRVNSTTSIK